MPIMGVVGHGLPLPSIFYIMKHVIFSSNNYNLLPWMVTSLVSTFLSLSLNPSCHYDLFQLCFPYHMTYKFSLLFSDVCPHSCCVFAIGSISSLVIFLVQDILNIHLRNHISEGSIRFLIVYLRLGSKSARFARALTFLAPAECSLWLSYSFSDHHLNSA